MPQRLAGNGAPVRAAAADLEVALDERHAPVILGGHHGRALAGRTAAYDHDIELFHRHCPVTSWAKIDPTAGDSQRRSIIALQQSAGVATLTTRKSPSGFLQSQPATCAEHVQ